MYFLFNIAVFSSAFLVFLIQPMIANILLPKIGGSPNIWITCSVFFQFSLLIGYGYSYFLTQKIVLKHQLLFHSILLLIALFFINFNFTDLTVSPQEPIIELSIALIKTIFVPFVLLSTTSPLLQRWLSLSDLKQKENPYHLYIGSNIGSVLALYFYPLVLEKYVPISAQDSFWITGFCFFIICVFIISFFLRTTETAPLQETNNKNEKENPVLVFYWILFAFIPSSLMLSLTNHLSTNIGGVPFLWVLPLSLYLISFIFTFSKYYTEKTAKTFKVLYKYFFLISSILFFFVTTTSSSDKNISLIAISCLSYFIFSCYCHGVLAKTKPQPSRLTFFYLMLSIGGALGGFFNQFIAPYLFLSFTEYPIVILFSLPFVFSNIPSNFSELKPVLKSFFILFFVLLAALALGKLQFAFPKQSFFASVGLFLLCLAYLAFIFFPKTLPLCILTFLFVIIIINPRYKAIYQSRNYFGTIIVDKRNINNLPQNGSVLLLLHGDTIHGKQNIFINAEGSEEYSYDPDTYYGKNSAIKDFFQVLDKPHPSIAWLGLGSGATLCYAPDSKLTDIYEINKDMIALSVQKKIFRYLNKCAPNANVFETDGRMGIAQASNNKYDLIVLDVFSSHFIPVHMTTKEAVQIYKSKLKQDGMILFHINSRAFDIEPILSKIAEEIGMIFITRKNNTEPYPRWGVLASTETPEIKALLETKGWYRSKPKPNSPLWTDDFHNLFSALRK